MRLRTLLIPLAGLVPVTAGAMSCGEAAATMCRHALDASANCPAALEAFDRPWAIVADYYIIEAERIAYIRIGL